MRTPLTMGKTEYPVSEYLTVYGGRDIYRTGSWWKAVVKYEFQDGSNSTETAIYLWHNDGEEWARKNKYTIKTREAWDEDNVAIESVMEAPEDLAADDEFPVSDYYHVAAGETIFRTDEWWKAIVRIDEKGDYETEELIIYVWQHSDGQWRRRQKYAIKGRDDWEEECKVVRAVLDDETTKSEDGRTSEKSTDGPLGVGELDIKAQKHLSADLSEDW